MVMKDESNERLMGAIGLPSIFELIAQDRLSISIQEALRYIVKCLYQSNPSRYKTLWKWYDEFYATADLILQSFYLKKYGGSLAENFYGMKRVINGTCKTASTGFPKLRSLFMLVGWPYIMKKLEKLHMLLSTYTTVCNSRIVILILLFMTLKRYSIFYFINIYFGFLDIRNPLKNRIPSLQWYVRKLVDLKSIFTQFPLIHILVNYYPWMKTLFSTFAFFLKIGYILSLCDVHSPELKIANVHLVKFTGIDFSEANKKSWRALAVLTSILTQFITFGLYCIQFLDFYYNSDTGENFRMEQRIKNWKYPPAPHKKLRENSVLLLETNKCPLCLRQRSNDTVLAVSGYVFCYGCIYSYVEQEKKCPVTNLSADIHDLIKIYVPSSCK